ncbi:MAG: imidazolonepropionase [Bacteroidota bacterium]
MALLVTNIRSLVHIEETPRTSYSGGEMDGLQELHDAFLFVVDGHIESFGRQTPEAVAAIRQLHSDIHELDAAGGHVFPSWCDAHTHVVYAGSRELEFVDRIKGLSYQEIAERGGGILNSARRLRNTTEEELYRDALARIQDMIAGGTGSIEIKSGYGLDLNSELKMLRVIKRLKEQVTANIRSTFLGAHAVPDEFKNDKAGYIRLLKESLIPAIAEERLADFCDVFCEKGYFTKEETLDILDSAQKFGMKAKVHAEQLSHSGGIEAGVKANAISVDHLEFTDDRDISLLAGSESIPVLLPGAQLFLGLQSPPVRKMIGAGLPVALSTDFNPGSSPSGNMNQMVSLACILYKMTPSEAIIAATSNSAAAMGVAAETGSIAKGKRADFFITRPIPSYAFLPYYFGQNLVQTTVLGGNIISGNK